MGRGRRSLFSTKVFAIAQGLTPTGWGALCVIGDEG